MDIRPLQPDLFEAWLRFRRQHYPSFPHYATPAFYRYRFEQCPSNQRPVHRVAIHQGEVVGELYAVRVHLSVGSIVEAAWQPADLMVAERFRRLGLWRHLMTEVVRPLECASFFALAPGPHTYAFYKSFGPYQIFPSAAWYHWPINLEPYFRRRGYSHRTALLLGWVTHPLTWKIKYAVRRQPPVPPGLRIEAAELPSDFNNHCFTDGSPMVQHKAEWYQWHMQAVDGFKSSDQFFQAIDQSGVRIGFAICGHVRRYVCPGSAPTWIGLIKECRLLPNNGGVRLHLLRACLQWLCRKPGLEAVRVLGTASSANYLRELGFQQRESHTSLLGGPILSSLRDQCVDVCSHDDAEVRLG